MNNQENFTEKDSLRLITDMINKTKQSFHDTGFGPIMWGSVIIICALTSFFSLQYNFKLPFNIWLLTIVAIIPQILYSIAEGKRKKAKTYNDIAMDYTWIGFGICIFILSFGINILASDMRNGITDYLKNRGDFRFGDYTTSFYLMLYGIPTFITGGIMKFKPMLFGGILCWALSLVSNYTNLKIDMLLTALAGLFAWLIPGIIIYIRCKKNKSMHV